MGSEELHIKEQDGTGGGRRAGQETDRRRPAGRPAAGSLMGLFKSFFKFGCFTFGGGWSIIAQMQREFVENDNAISNEELLDLTSVARGLPGTMIGNVAMLYGYRVAGIAGGVIAVVSLIMPPLIILSVIAYFYEIFRSSVPAQAMLSGIRAAVVPMIAVAAVKMVNGAFTHPICYGIVALCLFLFLRFNVSCVYLVLIGAACGLLIGALRKKEKTHAAGAAEVAEAAGTAEVVEATKAAESAEDTEDKRDVKEGWQ